MIPCTGKVFILGDINTQVGKDCQTWGGSGKKSLESAIVLVF